MANTYLDAAYAISLPAGQKSVLVALANRANKKGECFPSVRCISADTGLGRSTIHAHLKTLVTDKVIKKTNQFRKDNSQTSNLYKLLIEPVKKAAKKAKKAIKKGFDKAVDMGNKVFNGKIDAPALSAQITDSQKLELDYDNDQWEQVVANIGARALELYPNAGINTVKEAIEEHVEHWLLKANDNPRLTLTLGQLRAQFFQRERDFLEFLNTRNEQQESDILAGEYF